MATKKAAAKKEATKKEAPEAKKPRTDLKTAKGTSVKAVL